MFKNFLIVLGLSGWAGVAASLLPVPRTTPLSHKTPGACVRIDGIAGSGSEYAGSGVVVGVKDWRSYIVTCKHLTKPAAYLAVTWGSESLPARIELEDPEADIAILSVCGRHEASEVTGEQPAISALVRCWGHTQGGPANFRCAMVTVVGLDPIQDGGIPSGIIMPFGAFGGDSGSGVFDTRGRVCGILSYIRRENPTRCYVVPGERVAKLLAEAMK